MGKFEISEISILPLRPRNGFVAIASCVFNNQIYIGEIALYTSPNKVLGFRCQFPAKRLGNGKVVSCCHPLNVDVEQQISDAIIRKYLEVMDNFNHIES